MDLSIIERVFALRDEVRKAGLGDNAPDLASLTRGGHEGFEQPTGLPDDKAALKLMGRALLLSEASAEHPIDPKADAYVAELLTAAAAPLPTFRDADLGSDGPPPPVPAPPSRRPPVMPGTPASTIRERDVDVPERPAAKRSAPKKKKKGGRSKKDRDG